MVWFAHLDAGWERSITKQRPNYPPQTGFVYATDQAATQVNMKMRLLKASCHFLSAVQYSIAAIEGMAA